MGEPPPSQRNEFSGSGLACRRGERLVFADLGFRLSAGDALVLRGRNGSGKSSLLRLMAGLARPEAGALLWNGQDAHEDHEAHAGRLLFIGHLDGIKLALTVAENLRFWARLRGSADPAPIAAALTRVNLARLAETPARLLSAGQRRRLALARLMAVPAPLWLLDEPSVGLDDESLSVLEAMLAEHRAGGGIVAVATHTDIALPGAQTLGLDEYARAPIMDTAP